MLLDRPKRALAVLLSVLLLSVSLVLALRDTSTQQERDPSYVITLRHYGIDGREMERTVAIPLEDALSAIPGVTHVLTTSEQGKVRCFVRFSGLSAGSYEAVRDAAQRVYETLPPSAQRPELSSSRDSRVPVWSAAVFLKTDLAVSSRAGSAMARADAPSLDLATSSRAGSAMDRADAPSSNLAVSSRAGSAMDRADAPSSNLASPSGPGSAMAGPGQSLGSILERIVKPAFERLDGAGEVELAGTGLPELVIYLDERACAARGIEAWQVARQLSEQDLLLPGGSITEADRDIMLTIDGRYKTAQDIYEAPILLPGGQMVPLSTLGRIVEQDRKPEAIARLDGQAAAVISIMGSSSIPIAQLSRSIQQTVKELGRLPLEFYVLSDRGAEETAAFRSVLSATLQGSLIVAVAVALLAGASSLMGILSVPLIMLFSAAALKLAGFSLDRLSLAGLACGVGAAVDSTILVVERLHRTKDGSQKAAALGALAPSLIASVSTTIVALIPLALLGASSGIVTSIAWGIGTSSAVALVYALFLLPAFVGGSQSGYASYKRKAHTGLNNRYGRYWSSPVHLLHRLKRRALRLFGAVLMGSYQRPLLILLMGLALSLGGMGALFFSGADVASLPSEDSVYAQIEFEGGLLAERVDELVAEYGQRIRANKGIRAVQTSARTASASVMISFDPQKIDGEILRNLARSTPVYGGFVYIPEGSATDRIWTLTVYGDDDELCRNLVKTLASRAQASPLVKEAVLNFKDGSPRLFLEYDGARMASLGLSAAGMADSLRRAVFGPVIYKRLDERGETDVRLRYASEEYLDKKALYQIPLGPSIQIASVVGSREDREPASIRRENRRRVASFSIRTKPMDPRRVRAALMPLLREVKLPPGYSISFDREAIKSAEELSRMGVYFFLALFFCFMVIAAATESIRVPVVILLTVPPALGLPALVSLITGASVDISLACAFVAVSGIAVNAAVLAVEALREGGPISSIWNLYKSLRQRLPSLLATSLTTIAGSLPFLFASGAANQMVRSLALVTTLGVAGSFIASISLIPALAKLWPGFTQAQDTGVSGAIQINTSEEGALP